MSLLVEKLFMSTKRTCAHGDKGLGVAGICHEPHMADVAMASTNSSPIGHSSI